MDKRRYLLKKRRNSYRTSRNVIFSFKYAISGLNYCIKYERNFKIQVFLGIFSIFLSLFLQFTTIENVVLSATIFSVLILELLNTSIENIVDLLVDQEFSQLAKIAKDSAAAAVFLASINSIFVALYLFVPKIKLLFINL